MSKHPRDLLAAGLCLAVWLGRAGFGSAETLKPPLISTPPLIDGDLSDSCWQNIVPVHTFAKDAPGSPLSDVRVCYDRDNLYLAFSCPDPRIRELLVEHSTRDGDVWADECVEIFIDPRRDRETYYHFVVNPKGVQYDGRRSREEVGAGWNGHWRSAAKIQGDAWTCEIAIPLAELVDGPTVGNTWGMTFCRSRHIRGEKNVPSCWQGWYHRPQDFGAMELPGVDFARIYYSRSGKVENGNFEQGLAGFDCTGTPALADGPFGRCVRLAPGQSLTKRLSPLKYTPSAFFDASLRCSGQGGENTVAEIIVRLKEETAGRDFTLQYLVGETNRSGAWQGREFRQELAGNPGGWFHLEQNLARPFLLESAAARPASLLVESLQITARRGSLELDNIFLGGEAFDTLVPDYRVDLPGELSPGLAWLKDERLRIYYGAPCGIRSTGPVWGIEKVKSAGLNAVVVSAGPFWQQNPFRAALTQSALIEARLAGLRVFAGGSYVWRKGQKTNHFWMDKDGKNSWVACHRDKSVWQEGLEEPLLALADWLKDSKLENLVTGYEFDLEHWGEELICYADECFYAFLKKQGVKKEIAPEKRHLWLLMNEQLAAYENWQRQEIAGTVSEIVRKAHTRLPDLLFMFYPFKPADGFHLAVLKGISTPRVPGIPFDDTTYWTGYSGMDAYIISAREKIAKDLGFNVLHAPAIDYFTSTNYPSYTPRRAAREYYLLARSSAATIVYGETRPNEDPVESHRPYWPAFETASRYLLEDKVITRLGPPALAEREKTGLRKLQSDLRSQARAKWLHECGPAGQVSDPAPEVSSQENRRLLKKDLNGCFTQYVSRFGGNGGDILDNGEAGRYNFNISGPAPAGKAVLSFRGKPQWHAKEAFVLLKVNGTEIGLIPVGSREMIGKARDFQVYAREVPISLLRPATTVEAGYFEGNTLEDFRVDTVFLLDWITLELTREKP